MPEKKLRCDVNDKEHPPCTNCEMERFACELPERSRRRNFPKVHARWTGTSANVIPIALPVTNETRQYHSMQSELALRDSFGNNPAPRLAWSREICYPQEDETTPEDAETLTRSPSQSARDGEPDFGLLFDWATTNSGMSFVSFVGAPALKGVIEDIHSCQQVLSNQLREAYLSPQLDLYAKRLNRSIRLTPKPEPPANPDGGFWSHVQNHKFLETDAYKRLSASEFESLVEGCCFQVPERSTLNSFVREYFLYVHPMLPILNEREFWVAFYDIRDNSTPVRRISLFLFQAMLAASSIVS